MSGYTKEMIKEIDGILMNMEIVLTCGSICNGINRRKRTQSVRGTYSLY